jgi:kynurenine formamidase
VKIVDLSRELYHRTPSYPGHPPVIAIDEYPLEKCIVPGSCIDLRHIAPRAEIMPADLEAAVAEAGLPLPRGAPSCSAPVTTSEHSPTRNIPATIPA